MAVLNAFDFLRWLGPVKFTERRLAWPLAHATYCVSQMCSWHAAQSAFPERGLGFTKPTLQQIHRICIIDKRCTFKLIYTAIQSKVIKLFLQLSIYICNIHRILEKKITYIHRILEKKMVSMQLYTSFPLQKAISLWYMTNRRWFPNQLYRWKTTMSHRADLFRLLLVPFQWASPPMLLLFQSCVGLRKERLSFGLGWAGVS